MQGFEHIGQKIKSVRICAAFPKKQNKRGRTERFARVLLLLLRDYGNREHIVLDNQYVQGFRDAESIQLSDFIVR